MSEAGRSFVSVRQCRGCGSPLSKRSQKVYCSNACQASVRRDTGTNVGWNPARRGSTAAADTTFGSTSRTPCPNCDSQLPTYKSRNAAAVATTADSDTPTVSRSDMGTYGTDHAGRGSASALRIVPRLATGECRAKAMVYPTWGTIDAKSETERFRSGLYGLDLALPVCKRPAGQTSAATPLSRFQSRT